MANDPHRDLLPVKDSDNKSSKGINEKFDHQLISKLKRNELEDRYLRLFDENTQIKKQLNTQEEKIKRLGTKLLRLINNKKNGTEPSIRKQFDENRAVEELQMRIVELEHENYTLKDKNIVLKQQLANHSRQHVAAHRSPVRSIHASPRISQRQSSAPNINESAYTMSNRNPATESQLREAESHINALNEEIKSLHAKIDSLQQDLEKSYLENQKSKVTENIELIRLQRALKQQAIQIAALQAQVKSAETNQKTLKEDLAKAHRENEEALQIVAEKQNEVLDLYTKLEEKSLTRLEQEELKERIHDLTLERDSLKERSEFLMKTITTKAKESETVNELKQLLAIEKSKKEELEEALENTKKLLQSGKQNATSNQESVRSNNVTSPMLTVLPIATSTQTSPERNRNHPHSPKISHRKELELLISTQLTQQKPVSVKSQHFKESKHDIVESSFTAKVRDSLAKSEQDKCGCDDEEEKKPQKSNIKSASTEKDPRRSILKSPALSASFHGLPAKTCNCGPVCFCDRSFLDSYGFPLQSDDLSHRSCSNPSQPMGERERIHCAEKMSLERELDYLRQMLRNQTLRCETQQAEITRLTYELKLNEDKYNDTLRRLDLHLKIFQHLEFRMLQDDKQQFTEEQKTSFLTIASELGNTDSGNVSEIRKEESPTKKRELVLSKSEEPVKLTKPEQVKEKDFKVEAKVGEIPGEKSDKKEEKVTANETPRSSEVGSDDQSPKKSSISPRGMEQKRFVDQTFLESSDEDEVDVIPDREAAYSGISEYETKHPVTKGLRSKLSSHSVQLQDEDTPSSPVKVSLNNTATYSAVSLVASFPSDSNFGFTKVESKREEHKSDVKVKKPVPKPRVAPKLSAKHLQSGELAITSTPENLKPSSKKDAITITILWLKLEPGSSVWNDDEVQLLFVDFSFLDVQGEETETPDSLLKPKKPEDRCEYNFTKVIEINDQRKLVFKTLLDKPEHELIVFKVVSDPEDYPDDFDCVDVGVAILTVEKFLKHRNDLIHLKVKNVMDLKEVIGILAVKLNTTTGIFE